VSNYRHLDRQFQLEGPANDVVLMKQLLTEQFGFKGNDITTLSEALGKKDGKLFPTRKNIEREFRTLARVAKEGDHVVILMAGHGSQQPESEASKNGPNPEPDGLDEIFLPCDVGKWDGTAGTVQNAIIDDELGDWLKAIQKKQAAVWVMLDSCHSGSMIRGAGNEKSRDVKPELGLGIPKKALDEAREAARKREARKGAATTRDGLIETTPFKLAEAGGLVAIYAAQAHEVTVECDLPPGARDARKCGLLTYTVYQTLTRAASAGKTLTYRELVHNVQQSYETTGRTFPTPVIEGKDIDREVLGVKKREALFRVKLRGKGGKWRVNAGAVHGLTTGSILAVSPPPDKGDKVVGHVRVDEVRMTEATVVPCAHGKVKLNKDLPQNGVCQAIYLDMGDHRMRVGVDLLDGAGSKAPSARVKALANLLQEMAGKEDSLVEQAADLTRADWLLRLHRGRVMLVPGKGWSQAYDDTRSTTFGPAPSGEQLGAWLDERLRRIARAENLRKLAASSGVNLSTGGDGHIKVKVEMYLCKDREDQVGTWRLPWPSTTTRFHDQDRVVFRIANPGKFPVDVTLLYIGSDYSIVCLWPDDEDNRIRPGERPVATIPMPVSDRTTGLEHLVVIGVRGRGTTQDFRGLQQEGLRRAGGTTECDLALASPLGELMKRSLYGKGSKRAMDRSEIQDYALGLMSWHVVKGKRPAPPK
jgi:hypothetical protein